MLVGTLIREMAARRLWPKPERPFTGHSLQEVIQFARQIKTPYWWEQGARNGGKKHLPHKCELQAFLKSHLEADEEIFAKDRVFPIFNSQAVGFNMS